MIPPLRITQKKQKKTTKTVLTKFILTNLLFILPLSLYSQVELSTNFSVGKAINRKLHVGEFKVSSPNGLSAFAGVNVSVPITEKVFFETGLATKYIYNRASINATKFTSYTVRAALPLTVGYKLCEIWRINGGILLQNNRDFNDIQLKQSFNFRLNYLIKIDYRLNQKFRLNLIFSDNVSQLGDAYFLNDPKSDLRMGVTYIINHKSNHE